MDSLVFFLFLYVLLVTVAAILILVYLSYLHEQNSQRHLHLLDAQRWRASTRAQLLAFRRVLQEPLDLKLYPSPSILTSHLQTPGASLRWSVELGTAKHSWQSLSETDSTPPSSDRLGENDPMLEDDGASQTALQQDYEASSETDVVPHTASPNSSAESAGMTNGDGVPADEGQRPGHPSDTLDASSAGRDGPCPPQGGTQVHTEPKRYEEGPRPATCSRHDAGSRADSNDEESRNLAENSDNQSGETNDQNTDAPFTVYHFVYVRTERTDQTNPRDREGDNSPDSSNPSREDQENQENGNDSCAYVAGNLIGHIDSSDEFSGHLPILISNSVYRPDEENDFHPVAGNLRSRIGSGSSDGPPSHPFAFTVDSPEVLEQHADRPPAYSVVDPLAGHWLTRVPLGDVTWERAALRVPRPPRLHDNQTEACHNTQSRRFLLNPRFSLGTPARTSSPRPHGPNDRAIYAFVPSRQTRLRHDGEEHAAYLASHSYVDDTWFEGLHVETDHQYSSLSSRGRGTTTGRCLNLDSALFLDHSNSRVEGSDPQQSGCGHGVRFPPALGRGRRGNPHRGSVTPGGSTEGRQGHGDVTSGGVTERLQGHGDVTSGGVTERRQGHSDVTSGEMAERRQSDADDDSSPRSGGHEMRRIAAVTTLDTSGPYVVHRRIRRSSSSENTPPEDGEERVRFPLPLLANPEAMSMSVSEYRQSLSRRFGCHSHGGSDVVATG